MQLSRQLAPPGGMIWVVRGFPNQFRQPGENKTANDETLGPDLPPAALSRSRRCARPQQTPGLNHLPGDERRNPKADFARSRNQGQGEGTVTRNAKQTPDQKITAFLHSQPGWNCECRRANR